MVAFEQITSIFNRHKDISISLYADDAFIFTKKKKISILSRKLSLKFWKSWSNGVLYPGRECANFPLQWIPNSASVPRPIAVFRKPSVYGTKPNFPGGIAPLRSLEMKNKLCSTLSSPT